MARPRVRNYAAEVARLDAISRTRALTDAESIELERLLWRIETKSQRGFPQKPFGDGARAEA